MQLKKFIRSISDKKIMSFRRFFELPSYLMVFQVGINRNNGIA